MLFRRYGKLATKLNFEKSNNQNVTLVGYLNILIRNVILPL